MRNLKVLGLVALAVLAVSAVSAQAAFGAAFNSEAENTIFEGDQVATEINEFSVTTGVVKCETAHFAGTQAGKTAEEVEVHPTYGVCKLAGQKAEVKTEGCNYRFKKIANIANGISSEVAVVCEPGKSITVSKEKCTVTVPGQEGLKTVELLNEAGPPKTVHAKANVTGIKYTEAGETCAAAGEHANGTYKGGVILKGFVDNGGTKGAQTGIFVE